MKLALRRLQRTQNTRRRDLLSACRFGLALEAQADGFFGSVESATNLSLHDTLLQPLTHELLPPLGDVRVHLLTGLALRTSFDLIAFFDFRAFVGEDSLDSRFIAAALATITGQSAVPHARDHRGAGAGKHETPNELA